MSFLTMIQEAAGSLNQPVPSAVFGVATGDAPLWRNLAQREGRDLASRHNWQALIASASPITLAAKQQAALASDYDRMPLSGDLWNLTLQQRYIGPVDHMIYEDLVIRGSAVLPGAWLIQNGNIYITPAPTAGQSLFYYYISNQWCQSSGGTPQAQWAADTDTGKLSENLMGLGVTWRWLKAKGMDYAEEMASYEREVERATSRDRNFGVMTSGSAPRDWAPGPTWSGTITP